MPIVRHHHEHWNGRGYPDGLSEGVVPLGARILAAADAFDAITSDRVYRKARSVTKAVEILVEGSAGQFDPAIVSATQAWIKKIESGLDKPGELAAQDLLDTQETCIMVA